MFFHVLMTAVSSLSIKYVHRTLAEMVCDRFAGMRQHHPQLTY